MIVICQASVLSTLLFRIMAPTAVTGRHKNDAGYGILHVARHLVATDTIRGSACRRRREEQLHFAEDLGTWLRSNKRGGEDPD